MGAKLRPGESEIGIGISLESGFVFVFVFVFILKRFEPTQKAKSARRFLARLGLVRCSGRRGTVHRVWTSALVVHRFMHRPAHRVWISLVAVDTVENLTTGTLPYRADGPQIARSRAVF